MEIKELIPKSKEIIVQPKTKGIFCDAFSYEISSPPKNGDSSTSLATSGKKYFYMVSQIQSNDSSLDYIPNLIATFIKRELEENPGQEQLFEKSLKKTNELIEDLLKENSNLKLDFGVAFIDKGKVAVSKIGKAKMLAYRLKTNDVFDVFENAAKTGKPQTSNKRFSNIVSGEIKKDDRFFFFIPNSGLNFKQKLINATLAKSVEGAFLENLRKIAAPPLNLSGIYFEIKEELKKVAKEAGSKETKPEFTEKEQKELPIVATEVAKISKSDTFKKTTDKFKEMIMGSDSNKLDDRKWKLIKSRGVSNYLIAVFIGVALVAGLVFLTRGNSKLKEALASINEKLKVSESRLLLKQNYEARKFLGEAIAEINALKENEKKEKVQLTAISLMNRIEKIDSLLQPSPVSDSDSWTKNILAGAEALGVSTNQIWFKDNKAIAYSPGADIKIIDLKSNKTTELKKKFNFEPIEFKNYKDNLYFLGSKNIYKITNALLKPKEGLEWLKPNEAAKISGNFVSFDLDSSVYVLTDDRKLVVMFKGEVAKIVDLDFDVRPGAELINLGGKEFLAVDKELKLARIINDAGELKVSYNLSAAETIKDTFFEKESRTLYLLSPTKIWSLKI
ncbi:MAG: hypothetical protein AAB584_02620 [Patescibacteria group bacterium]